MDGIHYGCSHPKCTYFVPNSRFGTVTYTTTSSVFVAIPLLPPADAAAVAKLKLRGRPAPTRGMCKRRGRDLSERARSGGDDLHGISRPNPLEFSLMLKCLILL